MPIIIQVDGVIGAGKSYYIKYVLIPALEALGYRVKVIDEPVEEWKDILPLFYADMTRWAYTFQTKVMMDRVEEVRRCLQFHQEVDIFISERGVTSDRMFMNILHADGHVNAIEMEMYGKWWNMWYSLIMCAPAAVIYLNTDLELCQQRIVKRARPGELSDSGEPLISVEYQAKLKEQHDIRYHNKSVVELITWIDTKVIEITDTDREIEEWKAETSQLMNNLLKKKLM